MDYGLIGAKLGHSFSKPIHEQLGGYAYELHALPTQAEFEAFLTARLFRAVNVTIPYKEAVIPYCAELDARAAAVGAVNCLVNRAGRLYGYNTDYAGFLSLAARTGISFAGKNVLILGTGGTQKTVRAAVQDAGAARITTVSRSARGGAVSYEAAASLRDTHIVVNTTPCGMYPDNAARPIDLAAFPALQGVLDVVYNPLRTRLVQQAQALGVPAAGGLAMLVEQARFACEIFLEKPVPAEKADEVLHTLLTDRANLVLIGMPSCGKSTFGRAAAEQLGKCFVDLDAEIERAAQRTIPEIFAAEGEDAFRARESAACREVAARTGCVIATGGGTVLRSENVEALRQNGVLVYLDRPLEALHVGGNRPLSVSLPALADMKNEREPLYRAAADATVCNDRDAGLVLAELLRAFEEGIK